MFVAMQKEKRLVHTYLPVTPLSVEVLAQPACLLSSQVGVKTTRLELQ